VEKVKKLLSLAGNNPSEHEASVAAEQAKKLMKKHDIREREIFKKASNIMRKKQGKKMNLQRWEIDLAAAFRLYLPVETLVSRGYRHTFVEFLGFESDVEVVIEMYDYVRKAIIKNSKLWDTSTERRSACQGAVARMTERFREMKKKEEESITKEDQEYAVIVVDKENQIDDYVEKQGWKVSQRRRSRVSGMAYSQGYHAANSISMNKQIR
jgi:hypothetical protein